eukprot:CAMPEP_0185155304 /NCGR_PEP_ID=MMETSP1139-20130426/352_1 /TAXON_ID=298111 /ORGANISM="Pavlova sp., Strain CCMP459" /LENGTH=156 /DNA_ID=CAMNT_0027720193 /DNA_START=302 /DNA_END=773 /DNA_ORIENTATION=+
MWPVAHYSRPGACSKRLIPAVIVCAENVREMSARLQGDALSWGVAAWLGSDEPRGALSVALAATKFGRALRPTARVTLCLHLAADGCPFVVGSKVAVAPRELGRLWGAVRLRGGAEEEADANRRTGCRDEGNDGACTRHVCARVLPGGESERKGFK